VKAGAGDRPPRLAYIAGGAGAWRDPEERQETGMADPTDLEVRRKRAYFNSWHRGTREMDLLIGGFAEENLASLTPEELGRYEQLLQLPDSDLYAWITGQAEIPEELDSNLLRELCKYRVDLVNR
jgi:antitoxin CptB